jgi:hypothetical protein
MPTVRRKGNTAEPHPGGKSNTDMLRDSHHERARDDLDEAFSGEENRGPARNEKTSTAHSSHVKTRKTVKSKDRTPRR